jgi:hypothetical protein
MRSRCVLDPVRPYTSYTKPHDLNSESARARMREKAASSAQCCSPTVPLLSSKYVFARQMTSYTRSDRTCSSPATTTPSSTPRRPYSSSRAPSRRCAHARASGLHNEQYEEAITDFRSALEQAEFESADGDVRALRANSSAPRRRSDAARRRTTTRSLAWRATATRQTSKRRTGASRSSTIQTRFVWLASFAFDFF